MLKKRFFSQAYFSFSDLMIFVVVGTIIYGVFSMAQAWTREFHPTTEIHLSILYLPYYTLLSGIRGCIAYFISFVFTLSVGYLAAKSQSAEKIIIPLLDVFQSIPVLGFLPGLILGLVALFPKTNFGLELAAILMIFTSQVWNMTLGYYVSIKSIPSDFIEASTIIGLTWRERLLKLELPYSAVSLVWNSMLSMAGGWFFLIPCEAMTLGDSQYRLPGIGAYMDVAIREGNLSAIVMAIFAMIFLIFSMDIVIWSPVLSWVKKFRLEQGAQQYTDEALMQIWLRESRLVFWFKVIFRQWFAFFKKPRRRKKLKLSRFFIIFIRKFEILKKTLSLFLYSAKFRFFFQKLGLCLFFIILMSVGYCAYQLFKVLIHFPFSNWLDLFRDTVWTFLRIVFALLLSTLWTVPVGIWLGISSKRLRIARPIIQVLASFPAPMIYPIVLGIFFSVGISLRWGAALLIVLGIQWCILFNVMAGASRIPEELTDVISLMKVSPFVRWKILYLPSIFPFLVTGWLSAAGAAWNTSIVAEYLPYNGNIFKTFGLGATLSSATVSGDFSRFAASLVIMVGVVTFLNRFFWSKIYTLAQKKYRIEI